MKWLGRLDDAFRDLGRGALSQKVSGTNRKRRNPAKPITMATILFGVSKLLARVLEEY